MGDFEADSLKSLKDYLNTLEKVNTTIISNSLNEEKEMIEKIIQSFSCAFEILDGLATPEEIPNNEEDVMELVHQRTKIVDSIVMGYLESMKLLHDAFFLGLTGRYTPGRMLLRGSQESMIRGLFYFGLTQKEHNEKYTKDKRIGRFFDEASRNMKMQPELPPVSLQNHMYEWLKLNKNSIHPGLKLMVKQLFDWGIWFGINLSFDEFWNRIGFKESYGAISGFVHTAFGTTYTYFETILDDFQTRKFWGAQFSKEVLKIHNDNVLDMIDFVSGLLLNSFPLKLISKNGVNRLKTTLSNFTIIQEKMPLIHSSMITIIKHKKKDE